MSPEARELYLFTIADGALYRQQGEPIIKNLAKKMVKGIFRRDLAIKLYGYLANNAAKKYTFELGQHGYASSWHQVKGYGIFSTTMRRQAAEKLLDHYMEQIEACAKVLQAKQRISNPTGGVRIVFNRLLGGWYIVRGPHQTPLGGRFNSKAEAQAHLRRNKNPIDLTTAKRKIRKHYRLKRQVTNAEAIAEIKNLERKRDRGLGWDDMDHRLAAALDIRA